MSVWTSKSLAYIFNNEVHLVRGFDLGVSNAIRLTFRLPHYESVSLIFGLETVLAGVLGVVCGSLLGQKLRRRFPSADPLVCAFGLLISAPLMAGCLILATGPPVPTFLILFFGQLFLNLNWALVADMLLVIFMSDRWLDVGLVILLSFHSCRAAF